MSHLLCGSQSFSESLITKHQVFQNYRRLQLLSDTREIYVP
ncbi:hypothetical protein TSMEX_004888 [Taenia solium]|eukprot:TsM_000533300 transcript=TsM_000533300 gene=TsM_000533300